MYNIPVAALWNSSSDVSDPSGSLERFVLGYLFVHNITPVKYESKATCQPCVTAAAAVVLGDASGLLTYVVRTTRIIIGYTVCGVNSKTLLAASVFFASRERNNITAVFEIIINKNSKISRSLGGKILACDTRHDGVVK